MPLRYWPSLGPETASITAGLPQMEKGLLDAELERHQIDGFARAGFVQQLREPETLTHVLRQLRENCVLLFGVSTRITRFIGGTEQLLQKRRRFRHDHALDALVRGNLSELLRYFD